MNMEALFFLALVIFAAVSTVATVAVVSNISTPNLFSITRSIVNFSGAGGIQLTGGDPIDDQFAPD